MLRVACLLISLLVAACAGSPAAPSASTPPTGGAPSASPAPARTPALTPSASAAVSSPVSSASAGTTSFPLFGAMPTQRVDAATAARLQDAVDRIGVATPDVIAAVISPAGTWAGAHGIDGPNGRPAEPTDEFAIASVTKTITAALVVKLAEQGKIDLEAPISQYVKALGVDGNGATVRQVLGMRSGMGDTVQAFYDAVYADCARTWTPKQILGTFGDPVGPPGTDNYSNPSYKLLGFAAETVTGQPMRIAFRSVLDPAGGARMMIQTASSKPPKPFALPLPGHNGDMAIEEFGRGGALPCLGFASGSLSASGIASDAPSLARWAWALANGEIVSQDGLTLMSTGYGLDAMPEIADGAFGHGGSQPGYGSVLALLPKERVVVVVFENDGDLDVPASARDIVRALKG